MLPSQSKRTKGIYRPFQKPSFLQDLKQRAIIDVSAADTMVHLSSALLLASTAFAAAAPAYNEVFARQDTCSVSSNYGTVNQAKLPDPFTTASGQKVTTKADFECRRKEISKIMQQYELGEYPPPPDKVEGSMSGNSITVRVTAARVPTLPRLAFGQEFQRLSDIFGQRYLQLWDLTGHDAYRSEPTPQRRAFEQLSTAFPDTFTTVIGRDGPHHVWLALPLAALTGEVADAIIAAHTQLGTAQPPSS